MKLESLKSEKFQKNKIGPKLMKNIIGGDRQYDSYTGNGTHYDTTTLQCTGNNYDQDSVYSGSMEGQKDHLEFKTMPSHWNTAVCSA